MSCKTGTFGSGPKMMNDKMNSSLVFVSFFHCLCRCHWLCRCRWICCCRCRCFNLVYVFVFVLSLSSLSLVLVLPSSSLCRCVVFTSSVFGSSNIGMHRFGTLNLLTLTLTLFLIPHSLFLIP
jgi:hypothetical protein